MALSRCLSELVFCRLRSKGCVRNSVVDPKRNRTHLPVRNRKLRGHKLAFHSFGMNENMVAQRYTESLVKVRLSHESLESRLPAFTLWAVKTIFLPSSSVVEHQQRSIEEL